MAKRWKHCIERYVPAGELVVINLKHECGDSAEIVAIGGGKKSLNRNFWDISGIKRGILVIFNGSDEDGYFSQEVVYDTDDDDYRWYSRAIFGNDVGSIHFCCEGPVQWVDENKVDCVPYYLGLEHTRWGETRMAHYGRNEPDSWDLSHYDMFRCVPKIVDNQLVVEKERLNRI